MCVRVWQNGGDSIESVADQPYHITLWIWGHLAGKDRRDALLRRGEQVNAASDMAIAFNDPKKLRDIAADHERSIGLLPTVEDSLKRGVELIALTDRVAAELDANDAAIAAAAKA